jgi:hypothetical protein
MIRATINALPDYVCVITQAGKIVQTNSAFDMDFPFSQQDLEKGVYTWSVFTELSSDFFRTVDESQEIVTQAARRFGDYVDVQLRIRSLHLNDDKDSSSFSNDIKGSTLKNTSTVQQQEEEAFVIIAKNLSAKTSTHSETPNEERTTRNNFEKKFKDAQFRKAMLEFCEQEKNAENVLFLEAVREYKKASFGLRMDMKQRIFDQFIKRESPMQLNLANDIVLEETIKISKAIADVDVFKSVEDCVTKIMVGDVYPRFIAAEKRQE